MDKVIKKLPVEVEVKKNTVIFTASTSNPDRMDDVIKQDGWNLESYLKNPVILFGHDYSALPVGKSIKTWVDGNLKIEVEFASKIYDFAATVEKLVKGGFLNAVSVGFKPTKYKSLSDGGYEFEEVELLEVSIVPVPANPEALISMKSLEGFDVNKAVKDGAIDVKIDVEEYEKLKGYKEKNKPALKEYRLMLKELRALAGLSKLEDEVKAITQLKSLLINTFQNAQPETPEAKTVEPETPEQKTYVLKVSDNSEWAKYFKKDK